MPAALGKLVVVELGVTTQRQVLNEFLSDKVSSPRVARAELEQAVVAVSLFVLGIVTDQSADLEGMSTHHLREVVLPDEQVFMVVPRSLMPEGGKATAAPICWHAGSGRLRKNRRELGRDLRIQRRSRRACRGSDVISGA